MSATWEASPEPGPEVTAVRDRSGVLWRRQHMAWSPNVDHGDEVHRHWYDLLRRGPLVDASGEAQ